MISLAKIDEYVTILVIYVDTQDDPTEALKITTIQESSFSGWGKGERRGCGKGEHLQGRFQNKTEQDFMAWVKSQRFIVCSV